MDIKNRIGEKAGPYREMVTHERLDAFSDAVSAPRSDEAAPTYLTRCRVGEFELFQRLGVPLHKVLHAEQEYSYEGPLRAGDTMAYETSLTQFFEKNASMCFLTFETVIRAEAAGGARPVGRSKTTIVVRGAS